MKGVNNFPNPLLERSVKKDSNEEKQKTTKENFDEEFSRFKKQLGVVERKMNRKDSQNILNIPNEDFLPRNFDRIINKDTIGRKREINYQSLLPWSVEINEMIHNIQDSRTDNLYDEVHEETLKKKVFFALKLLANLKIPPPDADDLLEFEQRNDKTKSSYIPFMANAFHNAFSSLKHEDSGIEEKPFSEWKDAYISSLKKYQSQSLEEIPKEPANPEWLEISEENKETYKKDFEEMVRMSNETLAGWCTGNSEQSVEYTTQGQKMILLTGDYITEDSNGDQENRRIAYVAVRVNNGMIEEVRGRYPNQNFPVEVVELVKEKITDLKKEGMREKENFGAKIDGLKDIVSLHKKISSMLDNQFLKKVLDDVNQYKEVVWYDAKKPVSYCIDHCSLGEMQKVLSSLTAKEWEIIFSKEDNYDGLGYSKMQDIGIFDALKERIIKEIEYFRKGVSDIDDYYRDSEDREVDQERLQETWNKRKKLAVQFTKKMNDFLKDKNFLDKNEKIKLKQIAFSQDQLEDNTKVLFGDSHVSLAGKKRGQGEGAGQTKPDFIFGDSTISGARGYEIVYKAVFGKLLLNDNHEVKLSADHVKSLVVFSSDSTSLNIKQLEKMSIEDSSLIDMYGQENNFPLDAEIAGSQKIVFHNVKNIPRESNNVTFSSCKDIYFPQLKNCSARINSYNQRNLFMPKVKTFKELSFDGCANIYTPELKEIRGFLFQFKGSAHWYAPKFQEIRKGDVRIKNNSWIYMPSSNYANKNTFFHNSSWIDLRSLESNNKMVGFFGYNSYVNLGSLGKNDSENREMIARVCSQDINRYGKNSRGTQVLTLTSKAKEMDLQDLQKRKEEHDYNIKFIKLGTLFSIAKSALCFDQYPEEEKKKLYEEVKNEFNEVFLKKQAEKEMLNPDVAKLLIDVTSWLE